MPVLILLNSPIDLRCVGRTLYKSVCDEIGRERYIGKIKKVVILGPQESLNCVREW